MTENTTITVKGNKMTIEVDLSKSFGLSSSGKTTIVASTQGNIAVEDHPGFQVGLNIFKKA